MLCWGSCVAPEFTMKFYSNIVSADDFANIDKGLLDKQWWKGEIGKTVAIARMFVTASDALFEKHINLESNCAMLAGVLPF